MRFLRRTRFQSVAALLLASVLFAGQAFGCCLANQRLGRLILSAFQSQAVRPASAHSCCPKEASAPARPDHSGCDKKACCIQDAGQRVPQIVSESLPVPGLSGLLLARLPAAASLLVTFVLPTADPADSGPPVYLRTLRLLV